MPRESMHFRPQVWLDRGRVGLYTKRPIEIPRLAERLNAGGELQSGQMHLTVNQATSVFGGSNPSSPTILFSGPPVNS